MELIMEDKIDENKYGTKYSGEPMTPQELLGANTPEFFVDWLIEYKGLNPDQKENIVSNLHSAFKHYRALGFMEGCAVASVPITPDVHMHFSLFGGKRGK